VGRICDLNSLVFLPISFLSRRRIKGLRQVVRARWGGGSIPPKAMCGSETVAMIIIGKSMLKTLLVVSTILMASTTMSPISWAKAGVLDAVVSISAENKPLGEVLAELSRAVGYDITVSAGWELESVSVQIKGQTLQFGLDRILRSLGRPNHVVMVKQAQKEIVIRIFDEAPEDVQLANNQDEVPLHRSTSVRTVEQKNAGGKLPPLVSPGEIHSVEKRVRPEDLEVIPPEEPGGRGVTQGELEDMIEKQKNQKISPEDLEVIPPEEPGGRGVTQGELEQIISEQDRSVGGGDSELVPPQ
jgi:hypothetical protein